MGVTIHFEGRLNSERDFNDLIRRAEEFAAKNHWKYEIFTNEHKLLLRVAENEDEDWEYEGPTKGISIQIEPDCDHLNLEFDSDHYIQEYCKTQFTHIEVHIAIVEFFRQIEQYFDVLEVDDEGEYWDTENQLLLQENLEACFRAIENAKRKDSNLQGPLRLENGRMIDLMS